MINNMFTIVSWLKQKLFSHWSRGPARKLSSIVSWLTQRLLDRIVVHAESLSCWLRDLTRSIPDRYVVSPVALLIVTWSPL